MYSPACESFWTIVFGSGYFDARVGSTTKRGDGKSYAFHGGSKELVGESKMLGDNGSGIAGCYYVHASDKGVVTGCTPWVY